jgi:hypothetical protein
MYACSPRWKADWITRQDLEQLLSLLAGRIQPSPWGEHTISLNHGLHFTGGEPFLNFELLLEAVGMAEELSVPSTFVETNCSWCASDETTRERLQLLRRAGLKGILISVNPFYAEYVPFERTQLGIRDRMPLEDYMALTKGDRLAEQVELLLMGRATRQLREFYPTYPARTFFHQPCRPPFLRNWHNHFDNYGNLMPGYCGGISLGHWSDLDTLVQEGIDLERHPVLRFLIAEDMQGLLHFAKDFGYQASREGYLSKCDLCLDLRRHLVSKKDFAELSPKEFYVHLRTHL